MKLNISLQSLNTIMRKNAVILVEIRIPNFSFVEEIEMFIDFLQQHPVMLFLY